MSRKSLIFCLAILAGMLVGIGIALCVLYSGTGDSGDDAKEKVADNARYLLFPAVPSDAVLLSCFSEADKVLENTVVQRTWKWTPKPSVSISELPPLNTIVMTSKASF